MKLPRCRSALVASLVAIFALLFSGCVEWLSQTLTFRHDAKADVLLIHQQYHGIFGGQEKAEKLDAKEEAELRGVVAEEKTFFFANWILELSVANLRRLAGEPADASAAQRPAERAADLEQTKLAALLAANLRVSSGPFFRDAAGRLGAVQRVRIDRFSQVLAQLNAVLRTSAQAGAADPKLSAAVRALLGKLGDPASEFFVVGPAQIGLRVPDCSAELDAFRAAMTEKDAKEFAQFEAAFAELGGRRETKDGKTIWTLGQASDRQTTLTREVSAKPYAPNAEAYAQAQFGIASAFDPAADLREFLGGDESAAAAPAASPAPAAGEKKP